VRSHLTKRGSFWRFARRVPKQYAALDERGIVQQSTKIRVADDPSAIRGGRIARALNEALEKYWRDLSSGGNPEQAARQYEAEREMAYKSQQKSGGICLYRHYDIYGRLLYVGITARPLDRLKEHTASPWFERIIRIEIERYASRAEAEAAERLAIRNERPEFNAMRPRFERAAA
jgi:hypothetical protein